MKSKTKIAIAGAGFAGAVLARELATSGEFEVTVFEERGHPAGNCHTARDRETGIMVHHYAPHIFNTSREDVWKYVNRWSQFGPYINRVKAVTQHGVFSLPINLLTINQFFKAKFSPAEAEKFLEKVGVSSIEDPSNIEEYALKHIGRDLYHNFVYGYTKKKWGVDPSLLPASNIKRLPVRFNYDDNYYNQKYQGIPFEGYTAMVEKMLAHPCITVHLNRRMDPSEIEYYDHVFWSGPIDGYFQYRHGRLNYRTLKFERFKVKGDFQGNPLMNYCEEHVPYTRVSEHKHLTPWESFEDSICFKEHSKMCEVGDIPFYPLRLAKDLGRFQQYAELAQTQKKVTFFGRLGTYRYLDMDKVIGESLDLALECIHKPRSDWPRFSVNILTGAH